MAKSSDAILGCSESIKCLSVQTSPHKKHNSWVFSIWSTYYNKSYMFTRVSNFAGIKTLFSFIGKQTFSTIKMLRSKILKYVSSKFQKIHVSSILYVLSSIVNTPVCTNNTSATLWMMDLPSRWSRKYPREQQKNS